MVKSVICIVCAVIFLIINTIILFLKPEFNYALNDKENYCVYYQKWIKTVVYMSTIIMALFCIYFAINLNHVLAYCILSLECLLVVIYSLCKYKGVTITGEDIKVERLFRKELNTKFSNIAKVTYIPNAKIVVKLKKKTSFDVSFNSENFYKFYNSLIERDVKFKTGRIHNDENHVYLTKYNITIQFPKTMFREFYQNKAYLRNSKYLFSARSLENHEYIEGYYKESAKDISDFIDLIKNDLALNEFKYVSDKKENINGYDFTIIKSLNKMDKEKGRLAYIYQDRDNYFIIYADYLLENELDFVNKMKNAIRRSVYEDGKSKIVRV
ncbi:MAG: hypothetical protein E7167_02805 [Firmicutes bacterium]|nr:hypothetical protein [Bacillota bacterium]